MSTFLGVLRDNPNYRYTWIGQVVSEIGDHFNNIAVFSLALAHTKSGLVVSRSLLTSLSVTGSASDGTTYASDSDNAVAPSNNVLRSMVSPPLMLV